MIREVKRYESLDGKLYKSPIAAKQADFEFRFKRNWWDSHNTGFVFGILGGFFLGVSIGVTISY